MKKSGKLIVTLAVAAVLLFAIGAYIVMFHTEASVDHYVSRGNTAMDSENYKKAIRHYEKALELSGVDPQISIALANAYKASGNYTKAEYTLVSAITGAPHKTELYVALSRTYVEQEKFLDADQLLTRAASETVKQELQSMRPAPPSLNPAPGYYSSYVSLSASCVAGRVFLTVGGEYPANEGDLYSQPVDLPAGETTVQALVVDDSGLVSPIVTAVYTVAGVVEPITIQDPGLDAAVRQYLEKDAGEQLMTSDLWSIQSLVLGAGVGDLSQMPHFIGLKSLRIEDTSTPDLTPLISLPLLQSLDLSGVVISSDALDAIGQMTQLTRLYLSGCAVTDIEKLSSLKKLTTLDLSDNAITDIMPLTQMTALNNLNLSNNTIPSLQALQYCAELRILNLAGCGLKSLEVLAGMPDLLEVDISNNAVTSIEHLVQCTQLEKLTITDNQVADIGILPSLTKLRIFEASHNKITKIPQFSNGSQIHTLDLSYNGVTAVDGLKNAHSLNFLQLDYNKVTDLSPIENCSNLVQVDIWNNPVTEESVRKLTGHSIIVNYNPSYTG